MKLISASLTRTHRNEPLAAIEGLPGGGADLTPKQLRALAATLSRIADDCEANALNAKPRRGTLPPMQRSYPLAD